MPADRPLLFIIGGGDEADQITRDDGKIFVSGTTDLTRLLPDRDQHHRLYFTRNYFRQSRKANLGGYRTILNLITEPEHNSKVLGNLKKLLRSVPGRVVNSPDAVLRSTRDQVARLLSGIPGLTVPKTVRLRGGKAGVAQRIIEKAELAPPFIVREAGTHAGRILGLFDAIEDVFSELENGKEYFATQFVDFASADGLYRKYRVYFIGTHLILRHMFIADRWNVHVSNCAEFIADRPKLIAEQRAQFESAHPFPPGVNEVFRAVRERMPLDFFGMDFGVMKDGNVVLFEANATMSFFPLWPRYDPRFEFLTRCVGPAQAAFLELLGLPPQPAPSGIAPYRPSS